MGTPCIPGHAWSAMSGSNRVFPCWNAAKRATHSYSCQSFFFTLPAVSRPVAALVCSAACGGHGQREGSRGDRQNVFGKLFRNFLDRGGGGAIVKLLRGQSGWNLVRGGRKLFFPIDKANRHDAGGLVVCVLGRFFARSAGVGPIRRSATAGWVLPITLAAWAVVLSAAAVLKAFSLYRYGETLFGSRLLVLGVILLELLVSGGLVLDSKVARARVLGIIVFAGFAAAALVEGLQGLRELRVLRAGRSESLVHAGAGSDRGGQSADMWLFPE